MQFPDLRTYMTAVSDLKNIKIPFFQSESMQIYLNRRGVPYMSVGGFGVVFRFKDKQDNQFAVKCFTAPAPERAERYKALHDTLQITRFPFMVDFQYQEEGIQVGNKTFPVVVMEWGRGVTLDNAIATDLEDDGILQNAPVFARRLFKIVKTLQEWNMSHGDLQEGNLLVDDSNRLTLIDYDGMFVPALEGQEANELGLANYQHPKRKNTHFGSRLDDFALLSILFQLSITDRDKWKSYHEDRLLLLREIDYVKPAKSKLLNEGLASKVPHVRQLAKLLTEACGANPLKIEAIKKIEEDQKILDWLAGPAELVENRSYHSIISGILSLSPSQVESFEIEKTVNMDAYQDEKHRGREEGNWGFVRNLKNSLTGLLFEDVEEQDTHKPESQPASDGFLSKLKWKVMDLLYEEESLPPQKLPPQANPAQAPLDQEQVSPEIPDTAGEKLPTAPNHLAKTAKKPEWLKRRRRK